MKPTYTAETRRSGRWWAIEAPDLKGVFGLICVPSARFAAR
jgi:hypothetical protein